MNVAKDSEASVATAATTGNFLTKAESGRGDIII